jgi:hypothetical protein
MSCIANEVGVPVLVLFSPSSFENERHSGPSSSTLSVATNPHVLQNISPVLPSVSIAPLAQRGHRSLFRWVCVIRCNPFFRSIYKHLTKFIYDKVIFEAKTKSLNAKTKNQPSLFCLAVFAVLDGDLENTGVSQTAFGVDRFFLAWICASKDLKNPNSEFFSTFFAFLIFVFKILIFRVGNFFCKFYLSRKSTGSKCPDDFNNSKKRKPYIVFICRTAIKMETCPLCGEHVTTAHAVHVHIKKIHPQSILAQ